MSDDLDEFGLATTSAPKQGKSPKIRIKLPTFIHDEVLCEVDRYGDIYATEETDALALGSKIHKQLEDLLLDQQKQAMDSWDKWLGRLDRQYMENRETAAALAYASRVGMKVDERAVERLERKVNQDTTTYGTGYDAKFFIKSDGIIEE